MIVSYAVGTIHLFSVDHGIEGNKTQMNQLEPSKTKIPSYFLDQCSRHLYCSLIF